MAKRKQAEAEKTLASFRESIPLLCTELTEAEAAAAVKLQWTQRPSTRTPLRQSGRRRRALGPFYPTWSCSGRTTRLIEESSKIRGAVLLESSLGETHDIEPEDLQEKALQDVTLEQALMLSHLIASMIDSMIDSLIDSLIASLIDSLIVIAATVHSRLPAVLRSSAR